MYESTGGFPQNHILDTFGDHLNFFIKHKILFISETEHEVYDPKISAETSGDFSKNHFFWIRSEIVILKKFFTHRVSAA